LLSTKHPRDRNGETTTSAIDKRERDAYVNVTHVVATKEARVDWILVGDSVETIPLAVGAKALALADTTTASVNINTRNPDLSIIFGRNGVAANLSLYGRCNSPLPPRES
jgi:hypothetical protein